jgi:hypothetical protein
MSALQQNLKASHKLIRFVQPNCKAVLEKISQKFSLKIRDFSRGSLQRGDIVSDFLISILGQDVQMAVPGERMNESFSGAAMYILREWRAELPSELWGIRNHETIAFENALRKADIAAGPAAAPVFYKHISDWLDRPTESLQFLKEKFRIDFGLSDTYGKDPEINPDAPLEDIMSIDFDRVEYIRSILNK